MNKKACTTCHEEKPVESFYLHRKGETARETICKACDLKNHRAKYRGKKPGRVDAVRRADGSIDLVRR